MRGVTHGFTCGPLCHRLSSATLQPAFPVSRSGTYMSTWKTCRILKPGLINWPGTNQFLVHVLNTHLPEQANDQNHWFWICSLFTGTHTALKRYKINRTAKDTCLLNFDNSPWLRTISNAGICWLLKSYFSISWKITCGVSLINWWRTPYGGGENCSSHKTIFC